MTKERAKEIIGQARAKTIYGPWVDQLDKVMTPEEIKEVKQMWNTMDGSTNFVQALYRFVKGV